MPRGEDFIKDWEKEILKVFSDKNLIKVAVARRVPGVYVILGLARPGKYLGYIPQNNKKSS